MRNRHPVRLRLKVGDIVLIESDGFIGWAIRRVSRLNGEKPTRANHVAMVVAEPDLILDAQPPRVKIDPLFETYGAEGERIGIYRYKGLTDPMRRTLRERALKFECKPYGIVKIVLQWLGRRVHPWFRSLCFIDGRPICSYTVAVPFREAVGLEFGVPAKQATPDDIDDFIQANSHLFDTIRRMTPVDGDR